MLHEQEKREVIKQFKLLQILWICMLASLGLCVLLSHMASRAMMQNVQYTQPVSDISSSIPGLMNTENIIYLIGAGVLVFAYFFRQFVLEGRIKVNRGIRFRNVKPAFFANYYAATIIAMYIVETVGMAGTALFLSGRGFHHVYILALIGAACMLLIRPKREELEAMAGERIFDTQQAFSSRYRI